MSVRHFVDFQVIADELNSVLKAIPKGRIATPVYELMIVHKQSLGARDAVVATDVIRPPVLPCEGSFHAVFQLSEVELVWCQPLPHLSIVSLLVLSSPILEVLHRIELILSEWLILLPVLHKNVVMGNFAIMFRVNIVKFVPDTAYFIEPVTDFFIPFR